MILNIKIHKFHREQIHIIGRKTQQTYLGMINLF